MNRIKKALYKFSFSNKNPVFRLFANKALPDQLFGESYEIPYKNGCFPVRMERGNNGAIFDIHGGGYLFGSYMDENHLCHYLHEKTGLTVISCNYDLSDQSQFPTQIEQIYQTILTICADPSVETEKIFVMGHSAGGNAAAGVTLLFNDRGGFHIDGNVLVYPVLDLACDPKSRPKVKGNILPAGLMELFNELYFKTKNDANSPYASPLLAASDQLRKLPPTYVLTCAKDALRIDGLLYAERLRSLSVEVEQTEVAEIHGFLENGMNNYYGKTQEKSKTAAEEIDKIIRWLISHL